MLYNNEKKVKRSYAHLALVTSTDHLKKNQKIGQRIVTGLQKKQR